MTEQVQEIETFTLPSWGMVRLNREIEKLNRRADRIGQPNMFVNVIREFQIVDPRVEALYQENGIELDEWQRERLPKINMTEISLRGDAPKIEGYELMGTLDHYSIPGSVIVRTVPGQTIPREFHDRDATCDHCGKIRRRIETFVLKNEDGEHICVGRQCVRDFIGYDVAQLARFLERIRKFEDSFSDTEDERWWGSKVPQIFNKELVLASTFAVIRLKGWRARSACNFEEGEIPTSQHVISIFDPPRFSGYRGAEEDRRHHLEFVAAVKETEEQDLKLAEEAMDWLETQNDYNEYIHNLQTLMAADGIPLNMFGYWCSLAAAYERHLDRLEIQKNERKKQKNEWAGEVKERREFTVTVVSIKHIDGYYGVTHLHRMLDDEGRTLVWFANTNSGMEKGGTYRIKGTIKKLDEYKDWKQTVLSRVATLTEIEA